MNNYLKIMKIDIPTLIASIVGGTIMPFLMNIAPFLYITFLMVFVDMYSGVRAAKRRGEKISSRGFYRTVEKIFVYASTIIVLESITKVFSIPMSLTYMGALAIVITELKSFAENMKQITGVDILYRIKDILTGIQNKK